MSKLVGRVWSSEYTTRDFCEHGGFIQISQGELVASSGSDCDIQVKSLGKRQQS